MDASREKSLNRFSGSNIDAAVILINLSRFLKSHQTT